MGRLSLRTCVWLAATLVLGLRLTLLDAQTCPGCYARQYVPDLPMTGNGTCPGSSGGTEYNYIVDSELLISCRDCSGNTEIELTPE
jgi:hypothetical protein